MATEQREISGPYGGRGPRSYRRSDDRIREEICELLTQNADLDASDIDVSVEGGEVTLKGTVTTKDEKYLAEELVEMISGVHNIINRLRVDRR